jgi:transcriptional regulator, propionate catabolism operon regulatory protein
MNMDRKIGIIASDIELKIRILSLFKEEVESGQIIIDILDPDNMNEQGRILENKGAKAIIARSGGYRHIVGTVNVPVIHLKVTTPDILQALKIARSCNKDIVLVISDLDYFDYDEWKALFNVRIILERFNSKDEIYDRVNKFLDRKDDVVIVGGGIPCTLARKLGMDSVFINASKESIYEGVNHARELIDGLHDQKYKNEILRKTLDGVHDGVIAVDKRGNIALFNERAKELLKKNESEVMSKYVLEVFPQLGFMIDILKNKVIQYNGITVLGNISAAVNASILEVEGQIEGVLCSFQDVTKLQSMEKKIRYELNKKGLVARYSFEDIIANSSIMKDVVEKAKRIGLTDNTVMLYGESGTGKEMIAQSIHNISNRKSEPFVAINCAAISETLLESELFGYEEGAFTGARKGGKPGLFELAHGGSIFLDEINSISLNLQAKLLRVLEEREIMRIGSDYVIPLDVRIIVASNEELKGMIEEGRFRRDLFYRLNILELNIPPLRIRKKDIIPLFKHFLSSLTTETDTIKIDEKTEERLLNYEWPGNVRELKNMAQRYIIFNEVHLDESEIINNHGGRESGKYIDLKEINRFVEEKVIEMLLNQGMTKTEVAKALGISRTALWKKTKS